MSEIPEGAFATIQGLLDKPLQEDFVGVEGVGMVHLRELRAGALTKCHIASIQADVTTGQIEFDPARYQAVKLAASMENPSLGATVEERIQNYHTVTELPATVYTELSTRAERLSNTSLSKASELARVIESIPFLYKTLMMLAQRRGWLKDLDEVSVDELQMWVGLFERQEQQSRKVLQAIVGE